MEKTEVSRQREATKKYSIARPIAASLMAIAKRIAQKAKPITAAAEIMMFHIKGILFGFISSMSNYGMLSISSALLRVVSVMLAPPIIRASSRLRPSLSRGDTVV